MDAQERQRLALAASRAAHPDEMALPAFAVAVKALRQPEKPPKPWEVRGIVLNTATRKPDEVALWRGDGRSKVGPTPLRAAAGRFRPFGVYGPAAGRIGLPEAVAGLVGAGWGPQACMGP
jgi:hypothetical protein